MGSFPHYSGEQPAVQIMTPHHYNEPIHHILPRTGQPGQGLISSQANQVPYIQQNMHLPPGSVQSHHNSQLQNGHLICEGGEVHSSSSYTLSTSYTQQINSVEGSAWMGSGIHNAPSATTSMQATQHFSAQSATSKTHTNSDWQEYTSLAGRRYYYNKKTKESSWSKPMELMTLSERADASTEWKEHTTPEGRKYFYNKVTKQSKWTIPHEVKVAREQAEKSGLNVAKPESISASVTPGATCQPSPGEPSSTSSNTESTSVPYVHVTSSPTSGKVVVTSSNPLSTLGPPLAATTSGADPSTSLLGSTEDAAMQYDSTPDAAMQCDSTPDTPLAASLPAGSLCVNDQTDATQEILKSNDDNGSMPPVGNDQDVASKVLNEVEKCKASDIKPNFLPLEEKATLEEPSIYANKLEAKNAFKCLLESSNIESDWNWEQAMRVIINDKRYGALKTLEERKQTFHEFLGERKKKEVDDRRMKQKKAREDFIKMLEESREITSSTKWSKAMSMLDGDERFNAVERMRDREDLFDDFLVELRKKEKAKAAEDYKKNVMDYRDFLQSCDFIKANSQWRKVHERLEVDERCSRLDKFDRLKIFQDYINELVKEEEELQKIQKEKLRKEERKNRDEFRKLIEEHVNAGILTAKTLWRDYYMEVKELPSYQAVSSNTSGATPKELFNDVVEELEKKYADDKARIKDALKSRKIGMTSSSSYDFFKDTISNDDSLGAISEVNQKLIFAEILEKQKVKEEEKEFKRRQRDALDKQKVKEEEKESKKHQRLALDKQKVEEEEKETKKRQRLADGFSNMLYSIKEISASSTWQECKSLFEDCQYSSSGEGFMREVFEEHVLHLQEKAIDKERRRDGGKAKKDRHRDDIEKDKHMHWREHEKEKGKKRSRKDEVDINDGIPSTSLEENKTRNKDRERKHRKHDHDAKEGVDVTSLSDHRSRSKDKDRRHKHHHHHHNGLHDDINSDKDTREKSKSHRHSSDHKRSPRIYN